MPGCRSAWLMGRFEASADLEDASAAYRATEARVTSERAMLADELAEARTGADVGCTRQI